MHNEPQNVGQSISDDYNGPVFRNLLNVGIKALTSVST